MIYIKFNSDNVVNMFSETKKPNFNLCLNNSEIPEGFKKNYSFYNGVKDETNTVIGVVFNQSLKNEFDELVKKSLLEN